MPAGQKECQNCKTSFVIEAEDSAFYEKMGVPAPTFCPQCRMQRRMARRNERVLYSRQCDGTKQNIISYYDKDVSFPVYSREYWYSDKWDGLQYGRDYDFNKPFFQQLVELAQVAPRLQLWMVNTTNSDYSNYVVDSKDCYLCFTALGGNENCSYCSYLQNCLNCLDCYFINKCEMCYECFNCDTSYNLRYSSDSSNCRDSWFLIDCVNCSDCFGCVGLRGKQYHIFNEAYSKEDYLAKIQGFNLQSRQNIPDFIGKTEALALKFPKRYMHGRKNKDASGDYVLNSKNVHDAYLVTNSEDSKYIYFGLALKSSQDVTVSTLVNELLYECHAIPKSNYNIKFSDLCSNGSHDLEYCSNCDSSSNLFGCIGIRGKEYCILNKQYSKEEYAALKEKIIKHMNEMPHVDRGGLTYKYGELNPTQDSPFAYNESIAQEFFPLTKEEATTKGYRWKDLAPKSYQTTLSTFQVPDSSQGLTGDICKEVIECQHEATCADNCTGAFRIIPSELQFYQQSNLPLPKLCPNCRHQKRIKQRNPLKLWKRQCSCAGAGAKEYKNTTSHFHGSNQCPNEFRTSYAPERAEIVYCEQCYQAEVA